MDVYKIGVSIALQNNMSAGLAIIARDLLGIHAGIGQIESGLSRWSRAIGGVAAVMASAGIFKGLADIAKHGETLLDQQDKLQRAGMEMADVLRLQKNYYEEIAKAVPTTTAAEYLKTVNELRSVVGQMKAEQIAPWGLKVEALIANATGRSAAGEAFKLWRAIEMTGRSISDPVASQKLADAFVKDIIGSGGKLDASIYQAMAKRAGVAWANAAPKFLAGPMSVVAADLGGDTAGTALMSAYMFLTGATTLSKQQFEVLKKAHLIDPTKAKVDRGGRVNLAPGAIIGSDKYLGAGHFDLFGWVQNVMAPALAALSHGDRAVFDSLIAKIGRNRNVMRMLTMFSDPNFVEQINKDLAQWQQADSVDQAYNDALHRNPEMISEAFSKQWDSMLQAIGAPLMQAAIPVMQSVTSMFASIGAFMNANPTAIKILGEALAAVGAFLAIAGTIAIGSLIGIPAAIIGAVAAVGALVALNWNWLSSHVAEVVAAVSSLISLGWEKLTGAIAALGTLVYLEWDRIKAGAAAVADAISSLIRAITDLAASIGNAVKGIWNGIGGLFHHSSFESNEPAGSLLHKAEWMPGRQGQPIIVHTALNIDKREFARMSSTVLAEYHEFPTQAPHHDGRGLWSPPDSQAWTV